MSVNSLSNVVFSKAAQLSQAEIFNCQSTNVVSECEVAVNSFCTSVVCPHHAINSYNLPKMMVNDSCDNLLPQQTNLVLGGRSFLIIRGVDTTTHTWTDTDQELVTLENEMGNYLQNTSFGKAWISTFDITPVYNFTVDPNNNGYYAMSQTLRTIAINNGYNVDDYNVVAYIHQSSTDFGGAGALGSGNGLNGTLWANNNLTWYYQGNIHEIYHAFGVGHAETIEGGQAIYPGSVTGGHDPYHFMGSEGDAGLDSDIPNYMKYFLGWIDPTEITCVPDKPTTCETYRIYKASIVSNYNAANKYAIQFGDNLWISYEPDNANSRIEKKGLLLHYVPGPGSAITRLLDTRPNSITQLPSDLGSNWAPVIDFWDAAMEMGDVVSWEGTSIEIAAVGGTGDEKWVDIQFCDCLATTGDSDNDGVCDSADVCDGGDDTLDADSDLIPDACDSCPLSPTDDSNGDNICDNEQCLGFVADGFDYPTNTVLDGLSGGTAFNGGAWSSAWEQPNTMNGSIEVLANSLEFLGHNSNGNKLRFTLEEEDASKWVSRTLDTPFQNGETFWVSCLIKGEVVADGGFWIKPGGNQSIAIGKRWGSELAIDNNGSGINIQAGQVYKLVARYQLLNNETIVHLWVDRNEDFTNINADATKTVGAISEINQVHLSMERWGNGVVEIDELTIACEPPSLFVNNGITLNVKAALQGALLGSTNNLMRDDLRTQNLLPLEEPYTTLFNYNHVGGGGETINSNLLTTTGNSAIVDWLVLELYDVSNVKIATQSVLVNRNHQVVNTEGDSLIQFPNISQGDYYVAIRHRNHFGAMTLNPMTFNDTTVSLDFTDLNFSTWGINAQTVVNNSIQALWAGNTNADTEIIFQGNSNDNSRIFFDVLSDPNNSLGIPSYVSTGYQVSDLNLDGLSIYQGNNNEPNTLFFNILTHPDNTLLLNNYIMTEQIP